MRVDIVVPNEGPFAEEAVTNCGKFEQMGFDGLWLTDHVIGFEFFKPVYGDYWLEALSTLAYIAATTQTIRLGIGVMVTPYRDGVYAAKALSTIDNLSKGRVDLGVGTGWSRAEFHAVGRQDVFERRGAYTNEALDVMQACWSTTGDVTFSGEFHEFRKVRFEPKPVQQPRIPLWIGSLGSARAPMQRVAKYADYWHPSSLPPEELLHGSKIINDLAEREVPISIRGQLKCGFSVGEVQDWLGSYQEVGCVQAAIDIKEAGTFDEFMLSAQRVAEAALVLK